LDCFGYKTPVINQDENSPPKESNQMGSSLPARQRREDILKTHAKGLIIGRDVNLPLIARSTMGFSDADLAALCKQAERFSKFRDNEQVCMVDFEKALEHTLLNSPPGFLTSEIEREITAYHEAGHALAAWLTPQAAPINLISLLRSDLSHSEFNNLEENVGKYDNRASLQARLMVILGGRAAEEIAFGDVTVRAEDDLAAATQLARHMVTRWGMGSIGLMAVSYTKFGNEGGVEEEDILPPFSEETVSRIDRDVERILEECYQNVQKTLNNAREELDILAGFLLQEEHIDREMLVDLLGGRKFK
jgi:cell division protease FtsH